MNKKSTFKISIDDGYCEWIYPIKLDEEYSIDRIHQEICSCFNLDPKSSKGTLRHEYSEEEL
jgi:hypothetical protein